MNETCPICNDTGLVAVSGPDSFGMYETDDCECQAMSGTTASPAWKLDPKVVEGLKVINEAHTLYSPSHVFALFSGGHDSLSATAITAKHPRFTAAVHINTGIGIKETREFVRETCRDEGWPLLEYHPPISYRDYLLKWGWRGNTTGEPNPRTSLGFPGPGMHDSVYVRLKERCIDALIRDHKQERRGRILLCTGMRSAESDRRMQNIDEPIERHGARVWVNPIHDWSKIDCNRFIEAEGLSRNPVVDALHMSGECLCGSFGRAAEERAQLALWAPEADAEISELEREVREAGIWYATRWAHRPLTPILEDQLDIDGQTVRMRMCQSCEARNAA